MSSTNLRSALGAALKRPDPLVRIHLSSSLEHLRIPLRETLELDVTVPALESQQMLAHQAAKDEAEAQDTANGPDPVQTIPTVYAVSGRGLMEGAPEDQKLLREAVRQKLDDTGDVVVALVPVDTAAPAGEEPPPSSPELLAAAKQFVEDFDIPVVESLEALQEYIAEATGAATPAPSSDLLSMEKISWWRKYVEPSANQDSSSFHGDLKKYITDAGGMFEPFTEADVEKIEKAAGFDLHVDIHRFLTSIGRVLLPSFQMWAPANVIKVTRQLHRQAPVTKTMRQIALAGNSLPDGDQIFLLAQDGKAGLWVTSWRSHGFHGRKIADVIYQLTDNHK